MATINIGGQKNDKFYRYKMPDLIIKIEGKGNKTVLVNICAIAKALHRSPICMLKHDFCFEIYSIYLFIRYNKIFWL
jgi:translation initiation factor 5